ncbi:MAG TPA: hypothetical protein VMG38_06165 [Trebonia sp.]|nr:hypothetical protein [Trebonia sp.]
MRVPCLPRGTTPGTCRDTQPARAVVSRARRVVVPVLAVGACVLGIGGCSSLDKELGQQQAVVSFQDGTSNAMRLQVRAACGKLPDVSPVPLPSGVPLSESLSQVTFNVTNADDAEEARLQECLSKYKSVAGLDFQDSTDMGN